MDSPTQEVASNTEPQTPAVPIVPEKNRVNNPLVVVLSVLVFILLLAVGFLGYQNIQLRKQIATIPIVSISPTPSTTPDVTANWERHNFPKMGFSIALPAKWYTHDEILDMSGRGYGSWISYPVDNPSPQGQVVEGLVANIHLAVYEKPDTSLDQDANTRLTQPGHIEPTPQKLESKLDSERSIILKSPEVIQVISDHNGKRFLIQLGTDDPNLVQVFDQILSTFKYSSQ